MGRLKNSGDVEPVPGRHGCSVSEQAQCWFCPTCLSEDHDHEERGLACISELRGRIRSLEAERDTEATEHEETRALLGTSIADRSELKAVNTRLREALEQVCDTQSADMRPRQRQADNIAAMRRIARAALDTTRGG